MTCGGDAVVKGQVLVFPRGDMGNVRVPLSLKVPNLAVFGEKIKPCSGKSEPSSPARETSSNSVSK